jgi:hypothetical protein
MPNRLMKILVTLVMAPVLLYLGDWGVWSARSSGGGAMGSVAVSQSTVASLKGNKVEYYQEGSLQTPCSQSLFPQGAFSACWWLRRHARVVVQVPDGYSK